MAGLGTGTLIATAHGHTPVEALRPGCDIRTVDCGLRPVLGVREVRTESEPATLLGQVLVRAGAFGPGAPARDTVFAADHAVVFEGEAIQVGLLVNGLTIQRSSARKPLWAILLAEDGPVLVGSLPAESGHRALPDIAAEPQPAAAGGTSRRNDAVVARARVHLLARAASVGNPELPRAVRSEIRQFMSLWRSAPCWQPAIAGAPRPAQRPAV